MQAHVQNIESLKLVGYKALLRSSPQEANNMAAIPSLWQKLMPLAQSLAARKDLKRYAIITGDLPEGKEQMAEYYALVAVESFENIPEDLLRYEITHSKLVRCTHQGPPQTIGATAAKLIFEWLPTSGYSISQNAELFIYPEGYDRNNPQSHFDYLLFVK
ncbi:hypothetical protein AZI85_01540 [Bdellovibrio bacteriovorus]|uniref:AraC effector-binding domain-containing protein n=1 Tax=Bdellovibrio bacteriovorus TaxID=959 RepID=A0A150WW55_BDEBC|nr:GyrI-like domain-containing protein [Bdellovibrio bacteriovorus]KYG70646.1 hypothetical protein AZI85_01540 [Bdellovibrio bacteriovorus]